MECYFDGSSDDGLFYLARPKLWTPEVDGDILINESEIEKPTISKTYNVIPNKLAKNELIGVLRK